MGSVSVWRVIPLLLLLFVGVAVAAAGQAITGRGFPLVGAPVLMLVCGHAEGLRVTLVIGLVLAVVMFLGERTWARPRDVCEIAVPAAVTAPLWVLLVGLISHDVAGRLAGLVILGAVAMSAVPWMREARAESVTRDGDRWRTLLGSRWASSSAVGMLRDRRDEGVDGRPTAGENAGDARVDADAQPMEVVAGRADARALPGVFEHLRARRPQIATGAASSAMFALGGIGGTPIALYGRVNHWDPLRRRAVVNALAALTQLVVLVFLGFPDLRGPNMIVTLVAVAVGMIAGPLAAPRVTARLARKAMWATAAVLAAVLMVAGPQL